MARMEAMSVSQAVASRFSCRDFVTDRIPDLNLIRELLTKANRAASDGNVQPWKVYVLSGEARDSLTKALQESTTGPPAISEFHNYPDQQASSNIVFDDQELTEKTKERMNDFRKTKYGARRKECGDMLYKSIAVPKDDLAGKLKQLAKNANFFGAPIGVVVTVDRMFDRCGWGNVGMFLATLALLCEEAGLSTCFQGYMGVYHETVEKVLKDQIDLEKEIIWCGVAVGYRNEDHPINKWRTTRAPLEDFATFLHAKL